MEVPKIEFATKEEIKKRQEEKLREVVQYVAARSPFYQRHFKTHRIDPEKIKTLDDLTLIPPTTKEDLEKYNKDFICADKKSIIDYCNTSGTLGSPVNIPLTENDLQRLAYNEAVSFAGAGCTADDVFQLTTTIDKRFMAGLAYFEGARKLGAGFVRVGPGVPELQWRTIKEIEPTVLIAVPSFLLKLLEYAIKKGIAFKNSSVRKAICIGEPVRNPDFSPNAIGRKIREIWDIELYSTYASTEMAAAFTECNQFKGGHHHPDLVIVELLNNEDKAATKGEPGEVTITTLGNEAFPLIRFKTGDIASLYTEKCGCGRTTARLGPIIGRKQQMIKFKGTTVFPPAIFDIIDNIEGIKSYVVEVNSDVYDNDEVIVKLCASPEFNEKELIDSFRSNVRVVPRLEYLQPEILHKILFPENSRKPIKFVDNRNRKIFE